MAEKRPYGEERDGDVFPRACSGSCRMRSADRCRGLGRCRLEAKPRREDRAVSAYYDNRRGVLNAMNPGNGCTATVTTKAPPDLPPSDPVTVGLHSLKPFDDGGLPNYLVRAEGLVVDGPYRLTLRSLVARLDALAPRRAGRAGDSSGRR